MTFHPGKLAAADCSLLDRPVWNALITSLAPLALSAGAARALPSDVSPLAATASATRSDVDDLILCSADRNASIVTLEREGCWQSSHVQPVSSCYGVQMVAGDVAPPKDLHTVEDLGPDDALSMYDLARYTQPGPFERRTHLLGDFIGIKRDGVLVAMAGQRLRLPGFSEISAVCVASEYRSLGMGAELVRHMCARIFDQGQIPFLHTYQSNMNAIQLYAHLGFELRARMQVGVWGNGT